MNEKIKELADGIFVNCQACLFEDETEMIAKYVIEEMGYRKVSDIFEEIEEARERWESVFGKDHFGYGGDAYGYLQTDVDHTIYELRKKYESEGAGNENR